MKKSGCLPLAVACTLPFVLFPGLDNQRAIAQAKGSTELTLERISAEPDSPESNPQIKSLHWSSDSSQLAWMHLVTPSMAARNQLPQQEILVLHNDQSADHPETKTKAAILIAADKITASLRGKSPAVSPKINDNEEDSNPYLLIDFAWFPTSRSKVSSLLLVGKTALSLIDPTSGNSLTLVSGEEPISDASIAPDGSTVSFIRHHSLWLVNAGGALAHRVVPTAGEDILEGEPDWPYRNELHMARAYWWSPDSSHIAWLQTNDRAVAKYSLRESDGTSREIVYPKPGGELPSVQVFVKSATGSDKPVAIELKPAPQGYKGGIDEKLTREFYLPRIQWLPDGRHLAIERIDRRQHTLELFLADVHTGKSRLLLTEKDNYWINLSNDLHFLKDNNRFLWSSERTGYRHLYLYDLQGKQLAQLTHGDWVVTQLDAVDDANKHVYFTATEKSPLERHLYQVDLDGGNMVRITQTPGTHAPLFAPDSIHYADIFSSITQPPSLTLQQTDTKALNSSASISLSDTPAPPSLQPVDLLKIKMHTGVEMNAFLIRPPDFDPSKRYPVIVYMAGGPEDQLVRNKWGGATGLWMQFMARTGYLVFALDNRGTSGQGHYFEEPIHLRLGAQELADQRDGVLYLTSLPYVDATRLGACGWGYGGFLLVHSMLDRPVLFHAGFAGAPITDWNLYDAVFGERYLEDPVAHADGWDASTALDNARYFKNKLLVAQGTDDEFVHIENLLTLQDRLLDAGKSADTLLLADRKHSLEDKPTRIAVLARMTDFFIRNL